jgi:hypothetical protein
MDDKELKTENNKTSFIPYLGYLGALLTLFITFTGIVFGIISIVMLQKEEPSIERTHLIFFNIILIASSSILTLYSLITRMY